MVQSGGKKEKGNGPNSSYSDADLTDDETQPVDSQFFQKGGDIKSDEMNKWLMMQDTEPIDDLLQCGEDFDTQPVDLYGETQVLDLGGDTQVVDIGGETQVVDIGCETQVVDVGGKTQVVYDHDGVEYLKTQLLDECNSEVATDSDCEGSDRTEILFQTQGIFYDDLEEGNTNSITHPNLHKTSLFDGDKTGFKAQTDVQNNEKCHSGPVLGGLASLRIASMRASGLAAQNKALIRTTGDSNKSNSSFELLTTNQDVPLVIEDSSNSDKQANKAHCLEDYAKHCKEQGNEIRCKLGSSAVRKLFADDATDETETPENGIDDAENAADLPQMFASQSALAGLSYVDSQEPGDESQANALGIVDRFLNFNAIESDQDIDLGKKSVENPKSVPSAKGTKSLAQRATRSTNEVGGTFDWDENREDEGGGEFFQKNKDLFCDKKSSTFPKMPKRFDPNCEDVSRSDSRLKSKSMKLNSEPEKTKSRKKIRKDLSKQLVDMYDDEIENNKTSKDVPDIADVGIDTQMAAEAMQSLCFGGSLMEDIPVSENERELKQNSSKKRLRSSIPVTRQSRKTEQVAGTSLKRSENAKKDCNRDSIGTKRTRSSSRLQHSSKEKRTEKPNEECANRASNIDDFDKGLGTLSNGCRSSKKTPFPEKLGSLAPVAHQTRQRSVTNHKKFTGNTSNSSAEEINDLQGAFTSNKSLPDDDALKIGTKGKIATENGNVGSSMRSDQMVHQKGIRSRRTRASMAQENCTGSAPVCLSSRKKRRVTEENLMHKCSESRHAQDASTNDAAVDVGGISIPKIPVNAKASKSSTRKSGLQGKQSVDINIANGGVEASPKDQSKASSAITTPINCMTPRRAEASPICMGDEYHERSCRRSTLRPSLIREAKSLHVTGLPVASNMKDSRKRREMTNVQVLFSRHLDPDIVKMQKKILTRLGASLASSMSEATHFVADEFVRTRNILEAIAFGKPVVTHLWLESCAQASCFIDEKNYILRDAKKEREFGFSMPTSIERASQHSLLQGRRVFITPNTKPSTEILAALVKAVHSLPIERCGRSGMKDVTSTDDILVLSCEDDYDLCVPFLEKGKTVYSSELLLNGIVTQKLEYERYELFTEHFKRTRSTVWMKKNNIQNSRLIKSK